MTLTTGDKTGWRIEDTAVRQELCEKYHLEAERFGFTCREHGLRVHPLVMQVDLSTSHTFSTSIHRHSAFQENPPFVFSYTPYAHVTYTYRTPPVLLPPSPSAEAPCGPYMQNDAIMDEPSYFGAVFLIQTQTTGPHAQALVVFHKGSRCWLLMSDVSAPPKVQDHVSSNELSCPVAPIRQIGILQINALHLLSVGAHAPKGHRMRGSDRNALDLLTDKGCINTPSTL